jgi:hypothetical protein
MISFTPSDANAYEFKARDRKGATVTIILSRCKVVCEQCPVVYHDNSNKTVREFCCCRCHSHAKESPIELKPDRISVTGQLMSVEEQLQLQQQRQEPNQG